MTIELFKEFDLVRIQERSSLPRGIGKLRSMLVSAYTNLKKRIGQTILRTYKLCFKFE